MQGEGRDSVDERKVEDRAPPPVVEEGEWVFLKIRRAQLRVALALGVGLVGAVGLGAWSLWSALPSLRAIEALLRELVRR